MNPNDIFNMAASIGRAQVAAAQAAHDARQPEVDRLKKLNAELLAALRAIAEMQGMTLIAPSLGTAADEAHQIGANKAFNQAAAIARAAIANAERAK